MRFGEERGIDKLEYLYSNDIPVRSPIRHSDREQGCH